MRERFFIWFNSFKVDFFIIEWIVLFWLYFWCEKRGLLILRLIGSVIGLEVLNLSEFILDSVCRKWLSLVCGSFFSWRSRWSVMKVLLNSRRLVSIRIFRICLFIDFWRLWYMKVVKYWFKVSNGKILIKVFMFIK